MALVTRSDLEEVCGVDQLCSGLRSGLDGAIHAVCELFNEHCRGLLFVDATNVFNSVNRVAAFWNARVLWPQCSRFPFNTYHKYASLLVQDGNAVNNCLLSKEGVTQGDPLSMMLYAVAVLPLIRSLKAPGMQTRNWYADDSSCVADLPSLKAWFDELLCKGPNYSYHPESSKTVLIVGPSDVEEASALFGDLGIRVVSGGRFLGGYIGESGLTADFVSEKAQLWSRCMQHLSDVAISQLQAAHAALARSLQFEWCHLQRVLPDCATLFTPLQVTLYTQFYPALFDGPVSEYEVRLFALPARFGGLGISDPVELAMLEFSSSWESASVLIDAICGATEFKVTDHLDQLAKVCHDVSGRREARVQCLLTSVLECMPSPVCHTIRRAIDFQISGWLTVLLLTCHHFDLSPQQFRDALLLRYHRPLSLMPSHCDGSGSTFDLSHALDCRKGGLVTQCHNEVRDALGDLAALAYKDVIREPFVCEGSDTAPALIADLGIKGVWLPQIEALFDIRVTDADAPSYLSRSVKNVLATVEEEKKRKYVTAAEARRGSFSPFVVTVDGALGPEAVLFLWCLAEKLSVRWERGYGEILEWIKARLSFAVIRATDLCLRGSCVQWRSDTGIDDGAGLPDVMIVLH